MNKGIKTNKICRIWERDGRFYLTDFDNVPVTPNYFTSDADAGEYARNEGFEEIFWMEEDNQ